MLSRDLFNRQEHLFSKLGKFYEWTKAQAKEYRRKANTTAKLDHTPEIVRDRIDSGRRMITTVWSPSSGAFFLDTSVYNKLQ
jgi:Na+-transporting NADH:ubiquinone oxidoreductase subunit NqrB